MLRGLRARARALVVEELAVLDARRAELAEELRRLPVLVNLQAEKIRAPSAKCRHPLCRKSRKVRGFCHVHYREWYVGHPRKRRVSPKHNWTQAEWAAVVRKINASCLESVSRSLGISKHAIRNKARKEDVNLFQGFYTVADVSRMTGYSSDQIGRALSALSIRSRRVKAKPAGAHGGWFKLSESDVARVVAWLRNEKRKPVEISEVERERRRQHMLRMHREGKVPKLKPRGPPRQPKTILSPEEIQAVRMASLAKAQVARRAGRKHDSNEFMREVRKREGRDLESRFQKGLAHLRSFAEEFGHACPASAYIAPDGYRLGDFLCNLRNRYRDDRRELAPERKVALEALPGWDWSPRLSALSGRVEELRCFALEQGHARPGARSGPLGHWVKEMRGHYRHGRLSEERIAELESIPGWQWVVPRGPRPR